MLTPEQQAALVIAAINNLPHKQDLLEGKFNFGCCTECCAACAVLSDLTTSDLIDAVIAHSTIGHESYDWWVNGKLDRSWLDIAWNLHLCPNHEHLDPNG